MDYSQYKQLEFRRKFWKFVGAEISIADPASQQEVGYIKMKAWKLREDVRIFRNRSMQQEVVQIHARQIIDFGATYDVTDSASGQTKFALRRKGLKSTFVRDHWDIQDTSGNVIGFAQETSGTLALMRRWLDIIPYVNIVSTFVFMFIVQTYDINMTGTDGSNTLVGRVTHRKNPFIVKMALDTSMAQAQVDPLIPLSCVAMLSVIDAVKNN
jgi:hypothetical protein